MSVSTLVLLGLAVVWAIVLLPEAVKKLSGVRNGDSIRSFNHQLSSLQRPGSRSNGGSNVIDMRTRSTNAPATQTATAGPVRTVSPAVRKRRQEVLTVLGAAAVLTLLCTVAFGSAFLVLHLLADALLVGYVVLLTQVSNAPAPARPSQQGYARGVSSAQELGAVGRVMPLDVRRVAN